MRPAARVSAQRSGDGAGKGRREVFKGVQGPADPLVVGCQRGELDGEEEGEAVSEFWKGKVAICNSASEMGMCLCEVS
jgi:hypothetical protein